MAGDYRPMPSGTMRRLAAMSSVSTRGPHHQVRPLRTARLPFSGPTTKSRPGPTMSAADRRARGGGAIWTSVATSQRRSWTGLGAHWGHAPTAPTSTPTPRQAACCATTRGEGRTSRCWSAGSSTARSASTGSAVGARGCSDGPTRRKRQCGGEEGLGHRGGRGGLRPGRGYRERCSAMSRCSSGSGQSSAPARRLSSPGS
jgi:hypothetical protein